MTKSANDLGRLGLIGGTGLNAWSELVVEEQREVPTPYGAASAPLQIGTLAGQPVCFLPRHGQGHKIPPHCINYRANLWALHSAGVQNVIAVAAVGSMDKALPPGAIAAPDDLIDYSWGREHSYSSSPDQPLLHVEFTAPFCPTLRAKLLEAAGRAQVPILDQGVLGVTQGPRLESAAEIRRLTRDGCSMVGMTTMPEAGLARELQMNYACLALSVNWAAGLGEGEIHAQIEESIAAGVSKIQATVLALFSAAG